MQPHKGQVWLFCVLWESIAIGPSSYIERAATCVAFVHVFDEVLIPIRQEGYPDGIGYCSSSMECPRIFLSLAGRDLNWKPAHTFFGPDTALSEPIICWQTWLYHVASQHMNCGDGTICCLSNCLADTALPISLIPLDWQIWPFYLAYTTWLTDFVPSTWLYTTWWADMAIQRGLYHLIGRYDTKTWVVFKYDHATLPYTA
jgi:hypothetical protein